MDFLLKTLSIAWLTICLIYGIFVLFQTPDLIKEGDRYIESSITPAVTFVNTFSMTHDRMPTQREFYTWVREYYRVFTSDLNAKDDSLIADISTLTYTTDYRYFVTEKFITNHKIDWSKAFVICNLKNGEGDCYCSWTNKYDTNNWTWTSGIINLMYSAAIGSIPVLLWWLNLRLSRKVSPNKGFAQSGVAE